LSKELDASEFFKLPESAGDEGARFWDRKWSCPCCEYENVLTSKKQDRVSCKQCGARMKVHDTFLSGLGEAKGMQVPLRR